MTKLQAVLCDLDGTLIDSEAVALRVYTELWQRVTRQTIPADLAQIVAGKTVEERAAMLYEQGDKALTYQELIVLFRASFDRIWSQEGIAPLPGADAFLRTVHAAGVRLALVTSSGRQYVERVLEERAWTAFFSVVITREDAEHHKPAPDLYLEAVRQLQVASDVVVAIEDSFPGVQSAQAAGVRVLGVGASTHTGTLPATRVVTSLESTTFQDLEDLLTLSL